MYLLDGMPVPDHATFARFVSLYLSACSKETMAQMAALLYQLGEVSDELTIPSALTLRCHNPYFFFSSTAVICQLTGAQIR